MEWIRYNIQECLILQLSLDFEKELVLAFNYFSQKGFYYRCLTGS